MSATSSISQPYLTPTNENLNLSPAITASTYTIQQTDLGKVLIFNSATAQTVTVNKLSIGFTCRVIKIGAGALTVSAGTGVTLNSTNVSNVFTTQFASFNLENYATGVYLISNPALPNLGSAVASAAIIVPTGRVFHVTGTTGITAITATAVPAGTDITLIFDGILTVSAGGTLKLAGDFTTSAFDSLNLVWDSVNWIEKSRSVNA